MDAIGRKPVHLVDLDLQIIDGTVAYIPELERLGMFCALIAHSTDQAHPLLWSEGENREKVGLVEIDVQLAVDRRARRLNVGDIEHLLIGSARKSRSYRLANKGTRAIASGDIARSASFFVAVRATQTRNNVVAIFAEANQFGLPIDYHADTIESFNEKPFMLVLGKYLKE